MKHSHIYICPDLSATLLFNVPEIVYTFEEPPSTYFADKAKATYADIDAL